MSAGLTFLRVLLGAIVLAGGFTIATAAHAQLGTVRNPPPQHLFDFDGSPKPTNDGLGTMAERPRALAHSKTRRHPAHRSNK